MLHTEPGETFELPEGFLEQFEGMSVDDIEALLERLPAVEKANLDRLLASDDRIWRPLEGPQTEAALSEADVVGFGGAAGGGKTDLAIGLAMTEHLKTFIVRREATQLTGIVDRITEMVTNRDGYSGKDNIWRLPKRFARKKKNYGTGTTSLQSRQIEFGSVPNPGDETRYQGRPKDLLVVDEATNVPEAAVRFLMGWVRTTTPGQRTRTLLTFNPPTDAEGRWVIEYFAPWLDPRYPIPASPGEIRWFATIADRDFEVPDDRPFILVENQLVYEIPRGTPKDQIIKPQSRTFIPSRITDNPYLVRTGYMRQLQAMPEPLRSQMLYGDFQAGMEDDVWQVIPTRWVEEAQTRWQRLHKKEPMDSMGVDVARGGKDETVIYRRHGWWFDEPVAVPGRETKSGSKVAGLVVSNVRDHAPVHIDVIGVGASPYDYLNDLDLHVVGVNVAEKSHATDKSKRLTFMNLRSELWWKMRELLDPEANTGIALPPTRQLLLDLTAPKWSISGKTIKVESREDVIKRLGRSPDHASAIIMAAMQTPKHDKASVGIAAAQETVQYDPYQFMR